MTSLMIASMGLTLVPDEQRPPLSTLLRKETRPFHLAVEAAFDLDARLASRAAYTGLLRGLRTFYPAAEAALSVVAGWDSLTPPLDVSSRRRGSLLDADLSALDEPPPEPPATDVVVSSLAAGLGCLYVMEGSALGGRIISGRSRAALGEDLPVAFFSSAGRANLAADWRSLRAALDAFGSSQPDEVVAEVVVAAIAAFRALSAAAAGGTLR